MRTVVHSLGAFLIIIGLAMVGFLAFNMTARMIEGLDAHMVRLAPPNSIYTYPESAEPLASSPDGEPATLAIR